MKRRTARKAATRSGRSMSLLALGTCVWAACSGKVPLDSKSTVGVTVQADVATPPWVCNMKVDDSGPFAEFTTGTTFGDPDQAMTLSMTKTERWLFGTTKQETMSVLLNGSPLFQNTVNRYSFSSNINVFQSYSPPYAGVSTATASVIDGTLFAIVDGRAIVPVPVGTPPSAITYDDGQPGPNVTLDPQIQSALDDLISSSQADASQCFFDDTSQSISGDLFAAPNPSPHQSDTRSNFGCQGCRGGCSVAAGVCFYAAATSLACGPFVFFCAVGEIAACTGVEIGCLSACDQSGGPCCAVDCGGAGNPNFIAPPPPGQSVGCCTSGESCLNRASSICCSPGTTQCGGKDCCSGDAQCAPSVPNGVPDVCCSPANIGNAGNCCFFGGCSSDADCPSSACGADGCCRLG